MKKKTKTYYHILEYGSNGNVGWHGYKEKIEDAETECKRLKDFFPQYDFVIWVDTSKNEPPIITI